MLIHKAVEQPEGVLLNDNVILPNNSFGHVRESYNDWLSQGNTAEPVEKNDPWTSIRAERDSKINAVQFEYERYNRELRLNITPTRNADWMLALDNYVQDLANIPQVYEQTPGDIIWPKLPKN